MSTSKAAPQARREVCEYVQSNSGAPEKVFPLLCPVREAEWLPGWKYRLIYSQSGLAEPGCVFATPNEDGSETTWIVTHYDPANFQIAFAWIRPEMLATRLEISLLRAGLDRTRMHIRYTYTALSPAGERELQQMDAAWFAERMQRWEKSINHYLEQGTLISGAEWEKL